MDLTKKLTLPGKYCESLTHYKRWLTREVQIGDVPMGGTHPIRIQSMTTVDTMDTKGSVEQTLRMVEAGCEYVRITAPSIKEAQNLAEIKKELLKRGCKVPLVADIHFTPNAAEVAARIVEKVRVNPGNYADKKKFDQLTYTDAAYQAELERIYTKFAPLVKICKEYGTAMRIGTNHGSLSDRIMSHYGDTPEGMVESALEFIRICEDLHYYNLVISMKSSNPQVMVQAYRLLVEKMVAEGMNYPLHLGVTEAGDGEDGRIKSAVGIGTLLEDGLGDTVRVSLTEEPELEAPVARALVNRYVKRAEQVLEINYSQEIVTNSKLIVENLGSRHETKEVNAFIGGSMVPRVVADLSNKRLIDPMVLKDIGYIYDPLLDKYHMGDQSVDFVFFGDNLPSFTMPGNLKQVYNFATWLGLTNKENAHPLYTLHDYINASERDTNLNLVRIFHDDLESEAFENLPMDQTLVFVLETRQLHGMADQREFFVKLRSWGLEMPVIVKRSYDPVEFSGPVGDMMSPEEPISKLQLYAATDLGGLLIDGMGNGIWIDAASIPTDKLASASFAILQATRSRISKTEYISCPSCGRTLFDLQETTQMIRSRTNHLKGLKIAIMGCIVNGPGEMADADYGYVGAGPDRVTLYRGKEVVKKNVQSADALNELIEIIRADGNWVEFA
ncbi:MULTISPECIES: (E)-4-hydroxy-3-methylbut-2-enyl-diphosphate synthase [Olivibacter]|uniref:4-hydroxy-3-methylbut-2-en-1-yl diphosphate synthase (flavodoxin) n=1 Tax=Olivibacter jilunii TaxID=985016 RepID=A0ABW6B8R2_9SPHI|nr:(E)-4-hydroxy-3-methylbut-2-enyl-diphosphate synthase [Olivibacter jilunii]MCL4639569.1 (E)-4-hydroxy-3-methylbut-2-enyl-diphosphate synthase [Olivibacter sp. UJ_SKK_5.1]MDX3916042.1 (E)-4-hydroxy-3-methylbut-2-enyl-diphosphate synthase [Pseudosphingobacterium sp.]